MNTKKTALLKKKHTIKIPGDVKVFYCDKKKIITFLGLAQKKSIVLNMEVIWLSTKNMLLVTEIPTKKVSNAEKKTNKMVQGTLVAKIKQILVEVSYELHYKLNFIGVGYRAFTLESMENQLYFKLGYSHLIYFRIPQSLNSKEIKFTKLFLKGKSSVETICQTAASIRNCKKPEPYKGKGILYRGERISLKKGKKI